MSFSVEAKIKVNSHEKILKSIREKGGALILKHALGATTALYQIYPVGPESNHKDGSPHTRDTFTILESTKGTPVSIETGNILATKGQFGSSQQKFIPNGRNRLSFLAAGASFFLEHGTIYMEALPLIRQMIKIVHTNITNGLRKLNIEVR